VKRVTYGEPEWHPIGPEELADLIGEGVSLDD
jgi:hypothetical protein